MPLIEKHGGLWGDEPSGCGWVPVFEHYQPHPDFLGVVFRKSLLFKAVVFEKGFDRQWALPWWSARGPEALFNSEDEAVAHVLTLLSNSARGPNDALQG